MLLKILTSSAKILGGFVIIYLLAVLVIGRDQMLIHVFGPIDSKPVHFSSLVLKPTPNQFLVCRVEYCAAKPHMLSPTYGVPAEELKKHWVRLIADQPGIDAQVVETQSGQLTYIQRSELMRYPDSITVEFLPLGEGQSKLAIYSRSHYGKSDLGVNEKRIKAWLTTLEAGLQR